ncbi:hypothetical protein EVAR_25679_1 [Eumeta japonica]|uniref:Uncharacterized protein n=1 Tax=Eumeta variegata TaxID=151549 RepID=A0A4C1WH57_EUMVA|nr:hypothetical protein EVAR_25679_1 [Eumeta japonica]
MFVRYLSVNNARVKSHVLSIRAQLLPLPITPEAPKQLAAERLVLEMALAHCARVIMSSIYKQIRRGPADAALGSPRVPLTAVTLREIKITPVAITRSIKFNHRYQGIDAVNEITASGVMIAPRYRVAPVKRTDLTRLANTEGSAEEKKMCYTYKGCGLVSGVSQPAPAPAVMGIRPVAWVTSSARDRMWWCLIKFLGRFEDPIPIAISKEQKRAGIDTERRSGVGARAATAALPLLGVTKLSNTRAHLYNERAAVTPYLYRRSEQHFSEKKISVYMIRRRQMTNFDCRADVYGFYWRTARAGTDGAVEI